MSKSSGSNAGQIVMSIAQVVTTVVGGVLSNAASTRAGHEGALNRELAYYSLDKEQQNLMAAAQIEQKRIISIGIAVVVVVIILAVIIRIRRN